MARRRTPVPDPPSCIRQGQYRYTHVLIANAEGRTRTGTGVTAQRILSPLCLPFHHPGRDGKSRSYGLHYSFLSHEILWHFSYQLVIDWSLSRGKYTLPAEQSEEQSCCYRTRTLAVDLRSALLNFVPNP